jgi:hypothetical protein
MVSELTVIMKDEEKTLRNKSLIYEDYMVDSEDPIIRQAVEQTLKIFGAEPDSIKISITMVVE